MAIQEARIVSHILTDAVTRYIPDTYRNVPLTIDASPDCAPLLGDTEFQDVLLELINNCIEKDYPDVYVTVSITHDAAGGWFHLTVEDNVIYGPEQARAIVEHLNKGTARRSGKRERPEETDELMCCGITICKNFFRSRGGSLTYALSEDNRIIATAEFN